MATVIILPGHRKWSRRAAGKSQIIKTKLLTKLNLADYIDKVNPALVPTEEEILKRRQNACAKQKPKNE